MPSSVAYRFETEGNTEKLTNLKPLRAPTQRAMPVFDSIIAIILKQLVCAGVKYSAEMPKQVKPANVANVDPNKSSDTIGGALYFTT